MMTSDDNVGGWVKKGQNHDDVILECPLLIGNLSRGDLKLFLKVHSYLSILTKLPNLFLFSAKSVPFHVRFLSDSWEMLASEVTKNPDGFKIDFKQEACT